MLLWCTKCNVQCQQEHLDAKNQDNPHKGHIKSLVGIRPDIFVDEMKQMIWRLKMTNRLTIIGE